MQFYIKVIPVIQMWLLKKTPFSYIFTNFSNDSLLIESQKFKICQNLIPFGGAASLDGWHLPLRARGDEVLKLLILFPEFCRGSLSFVTGGVQKAADWYSTFNWAI